MYLKMIAKSFKNQAEINVLNIFKSRLKNLKNNYKQTEKQFNNLCKELDVQPLNEEHISEISTHLTIYLAEMDIIDENIKNISDVIERIRLELSN